MKHSEKVAPVAAVISAMLSLTCCLPLGIPAAIGLAGLARLAGHLGPWLIGLSFILLGIGLLQLYRRRACQRHNSISVVIYCIAAAIVLGLVLFPQFVASIGSDRLP